MKQMKVAGFTIARNVVKYDYPIVEAIRSVLPLCDEFVVAVGRSEDDTLGLIRSIGDPKIRIVETVWDDSMKTGGRVLALETDKAFAAISADVDWAFYIQGDEVLHERYIPLVKAAMLEFLEDSRVEGLLFNYLHFYGSFDFVGASTDWYRREIRVIRRLDDILSYRDAQGFRRGENRKLKVKLIDAYIYHYGWVRPPATMQLKSNAFTALYVGEKAVQSAGDFDYSNIDAVDRFEGTHPAVMLPRIERINWKFDHDVSIQRFSLKERFKRFVELLTGYRLWEYKNYVILK